MAGELGVSGGWGSGVGVWSGDKRLAWQEKWGGGVVRLSR